MIRRNVFEAVSTSDILFEVHVGQSDGGGWQLEGDHEGQAAKTELVEGDVTYGNTRTAKCVGIGENTKRNLSAAMYAEVRSK